MSTKSQSRAKRQFDIVLYADGRRRSNSLRRSIAAMVTFQSMVNSHAVRSTQYGAPRLNEQVLIYRQHRSHGLNGFDVIELCIIPRHLLQRGLVYCAGCLEDLPSTQAQCYQPRLSLCAVICRSAI